MQTGKTLTELAIELEAHQALKRDYVLDTRAIEMTPDAGHLILGGKIIDLPKTEWANIAEAA